MALKLPVLTQPAPALDQPLAAIARNLVGLRGALGLQRLLGLAQHLATITAGAQPLGQLVTALLAEQLVLGRVDARGVLQDLARDLLVAARGVMGRRGGDLRAVDRDDADPDQPAARAQRQDLAEQIGDRRLVAHPEARDRRVIWRVVGGDHAECDVVVAAPLDCPRRAHPDRVGVDEQRDHHRRIVRRATPTVVAIARVERPEIHLADGVKHKPRQMPLGQPIAQARRQQQLLLAITRDEVLRHPEIVLNPPDTTEVCATPSARRSSSCGARRRCRVSREAGAPAVSGARRRTSFVAPSRPAS